VVGQVFLSERQVLDRAEAFPRTDFHDPVDEVESHQQAPFFSPRAAGQARHTG
jgi:hypothetical protein